MKYYPSPSLIVILFSTLGVIIMVILWYKVNWNKWYLAIIPIIVSVIFLYFALQLPYAIKITEEEIEIIQIFHSKKFDKKQIHIRRATRKDMQNCIRIFGSGGFFGYTGWFNSPALGKFKMLSVNMKELAILETHNNSERYVINYPLELLTEC